jgi:hypothetical protein
MARRERTWSGSCRVRPDRNPWGDVMSGSKILVYRYLGDDEEEETDSTGEIEMPRLGDLIYRREKTWKVTGVFTNGLTDPIPRFLIHLLDMTKPEFVN